MANDFSKFTYGGTTYDIKDAVSRTRGVEYIFGTNTDSSPALTGRTTDSALYTGKIIAYYVAREIIPAANMPGCYLTLNLTLSGGGTTGAKNINDMDSTVSTPYKAGYCLLLLYQGSYWRLLTADANALNLRRPPYVNGMDRDVTFQSQVSSTRANKLAFLPADQIIIEKTTDGGTTWVDYGATDTQKANLFAETRGFGMSIPMIDGVKDLRCGVRVTFTAMKYNVPEGTTETQKYNYWNVDYVKSTERDCSLTDIYFWLSSSSDTIGVTVQRAAGNDSNNWVSVFDAPGWGMNGWSGADAIHFSNTVFGGGTNQTSQYWNWRITFMTRGLNGTDTMASTSQSSQQSISEIRAYGPNTWTTPNKLMSSDHLYGWGADQGAEFPYHIYPKTNSVGSLGLTNRYWNSVYTNGLSGTTMLGELKAQANRYNYEAGQAGGINLQNSDLTGVNGIYTADAADDAREGINFYRDATHFDSLWMNGGDLLFAPNRAKGVAVNKANSQKVARFTTNPTTSQVVMTDGTTGGVVSQAILPVVNGGTGVDALDEDLSMDSINPIQNQAIANAVSNLQQELATTTATFEDAIAQINETLGNQDGTLTQALNNINSVAVTATELINALRTINEELTRQIEEYAGMIETYLWVQSINGVVNVFKGIKNGSVQDRQTADQWAILQNGGEVIKVENGQATVNTVTVQNSLNLGKYTLTVDADGSWSIT